MGKYVYVRENKKKAHESGWWNDKKRLEVLTTFMATGSPSLTMMQTGVPVNTINAWRKQDWWKDQIQEIQQNDLEKLDTKLSKALDKALDAVMDRIESGDYIFDQKTGEIKRMPTKLRDLNSSFNTLIDKRQLLRKQPTKIVEQSSTAAQLMNLAEQFAKFVGKQHEEKLINEYIEGETVIQGTDGKYRTEEAHAIHVERKAQLQERIELGEEDTSQSSERPSGSEQS